mgnify:CR=1 FL=1
MSLTVEQLAAAVGIQSRMVRRYIAKEGIEPEGVSGRVKVTPARHACGLNAFLAATGAVQTIKSAILVGRAFRRAKILAALRAKAPNDRVLSYDEIREQAAKGVSHE